MTQRNAIAAVAMVILLYSFAWTLAVKGEKVNLNLASARQLEALPGIGPALAQRIIDHRKKNGPFKRIEDLMNVRGIGEKKFLQLEDRITVGEPASKTNPKRNPEQHRDKKFLRTVPDSGRIRTTLWREEKLLFDGVIPPLTTPFSEDGRVLYPALQKNLEFYAHEAAEMSTVVSE